MVPAAYLANSVPADVSTSVRDVTTTLAPCPAKPKHIARPMPRLPPVTIATLSRNVIATPCAASTLRALPVAQAWHAILMLASKRPAGPGNASLSLVCMEYSPGACQRRDAPQLSLPAPWRFPRMARAREVLHRRHAMLGRLGKELHELEHLLRYCA